jgi:hypothetical protein
MGGAVSAATNAPCRPPYTTRSQVFVVCARELSQRAARRHAGDSLDEGPPGAYQGLALCWDCADELTLLVGNIRAVDQEWDVEAD